MTIGRGDTNRNLIFILFLLYSFLEYHPTMIAECIINLKSFSWLLLRGRQGHSKNCHYNGTSKTRKISQIITDVGRHIEFGLKKKKLSNCHVLLSNSIANKPISDIHGVLPTVTEFSLLKGPCKMTPCSRQITYSHNIKLNNDDLLNSPMDQSEFIIWWNIFMQVGLTVKDGNVAYCWQNEGRNASLSNHVPGFSHSFIGGMFFFILLHNFNILTSLLQRGQYPVALIKVSIKKIKDKLYCHSWIIEVK